MVDDGFAVRMRKLREAKRPLRSMMVTSELMGLQSDAVRRYERGEARPSYDALKAIADYYNVSVDYLMGRTNY